jgi:hypothetical protein
MYVCLLIPTPQHRIFTTSELLHMAVIATVAIFLHLDSGHFEGEIRICIAKTTAYLVEWSLSTTIVEEENQLRSDLSHQCY